MLFLFLFIFQMGLAKGEELLMLSAPKELKIEKMELKIIQPIDGNLKLNVQPLNEDVLRLESVLKTEIKKKKNEVRIISIGSSIGKFIELQNGDYQHLSIHSEGKETSFWCFKGCDVLEKLSNKEKIDVLVIWREVERFIPEANEKMKIKETTHVSYNSGKKKSFYPCRSDKKLPRLEKGCEGEGCGFLKYNKAIKTVSVFETASRKSKILGNIKRCEKIEGFEPYTLLSELGWVEVLKPNKQLKKIGVKKGSVIQLTESLGEGYLTACSGIHKIDAVDQRIEKSGDVAEVQTLIQHKSEGWIKLKLKNGRSGYVPETENFYMGYHSYEPSQLCPEDHPLES
ncbi:MAG: hypothetical protein CL678_15125 [Bdellovibrionaceae bacterium]|nr:hypothetical protein [Pseudobdellovibrionaceae bacterium]